MKKLLTGMSRAIDRLLGTAEPRAQAPKAPSAGRSRLHLRALEPRVLLDAAAAATLAETVADADRQQHAEPAHDASQDSHDALLQALAVGEASPQAQLNIVFIDSSVEDAQALIQAIGDTAEVHLIAAGEDGVQAIAAAIAGRSGIDSIHIISHGVEGALQLGSVALDAETMAGRYADVLQGLRSSLAPDADILIYGCDFGGGAAGEEAAQLLAALTGADVAASTDATGAAALGGDWDLELHEGSIEAHAIDAPDYDHLLAAPTLDSAQSPIVTVNEDAGAPSGAVGQLLSTITIGETGTNKGIAVTATTETNGTWYYTTDGGTTWTAMGTGLSATNALLLADNAQTRIYFKPNANYNGTTSPLTFKSWDSSSGTAGTKATSTTGTNFSSNTDTVAVTVNSVTFNVLANDSFENNGAMVTGVVQPPNGEGSVTFATDGTMVFTPAKDFYGTTSFTYLVSSGGTTESTTVTVDVTPTPVVINPDTVSTPEDTPITIDVLGNDTGGVPLKVDSINGQPIRVGQTVPVNGGTVTLNPDGTLNFVPEPGFNGPVSFDYTADDGRGHSGSSTVQLNVTPVNDAPVLTDPATPLPALTTNDSDPVTQDFSHVFTDPDGDPLTYTATGLPPGLSLDPKTGLLTGTVAHDASSGGPYTVTVTATDPSGASVSTTFTWQVDNLPPVAHDDSVSTPLNTPLLIDALANDTDPDGDPLHYDPAMPPSAVHGTVNIGADGLLHYTPAPGYRGTDTIVYTVVDSDGAVSHATITVRVGLDNVAPVNQLPADFSMMEDGTLQLAGIAVQDAPNEPLTIDLSVDAGTLLAQSVAGVAVTGSGSGHLVLSGTTAALNAYLASADAPRYQPVADFNGAVQLTLTSDDGQYKSSSISTIHIAPMADAADDYLTTRAGQPVSFNVLTGQLGANADSFENPDRTVVSVTQPDASVGTVTFAPDGSMVFTPAAGFVGAANFTYTVSSGGVTETANVEVVVRAAIGQPQVVLPEPPQPKSPVPVLPLPHEPADSPRVARSDWPPVEVPLIVVDTVRALGSMGATPKIGSERPVLDAVNGVENLHPTAALDVGKPVLQAVNGVSPLSSIAFGNEVRLPESAVDSQPQRSELLGGSPVAGPAREQVNVASQLMPGDGQGRGDVEFDLHWQERQGWIEVHGRDAAGTWNTMDVTMQDGSPLPNWIRVVDRSYIVLDRAVGVDGVTLKVRLKWSDGTVREEMVHVGTQGRAAQASHNAPQDFAAQLASASRSQLDRRLMEALGGK